MKKPHHIYTLTDPRTQEVRYVGLTTSPTTRLLAHCIRPQDATKDWIDELNASDLVPTMDIVETVHGASLTDAQAVENDWVMHYRFVRGAALLNRQCTPTVSHASKVLDWSSVTLVVRPGTTRQKVEASIAAKRKEIANAEREIAELQSMLDEMGDGDSLAMKYIATPCHA